MLGIFEYSDICVWRARFEVLARLGGHRVLASILLNMFLGGRCVKFVMTLYVFAVA